jgi:UDP-glucose 4-epimerase
MPLAVDADDFDLVIHAAGANDVQSRDPAEALALSALTARQIAEFTARQRRHRLLYVSTFQVYGRDEGRIDETTPCLPRNDYALTHLFAEQWVEQYGRTHGLEWVNVRPANIAGMPRVGRMERWTLVPSCFCREAIRGKRIVVNSTGLQQRDFLSVTEVARRITNIAGDFDAYAGGAVNVCSGSTLTVGEVARMAADQFHAETGQNCDLKFNPGNNAFHRPPAPLVVDSRYFARLPHERLGQETVVSMMRACIDQTYAYLRNHPQDL